MDFCRRMHDVNCYFNICLFRTVIKIKSFIILAVLHLSVQRVCRPISASLRLDNTAPFEEMPQRGQAIGNTVSDLTGPGFEPNTSRSRNEHVTARPTAVTLGEK